MKKYDDSSFHHLILTTKTKIIRITHYQIQKLAICQIGLMMQHVVILPHPNRNTVNLQVLGFAKSSTIIDNFQLVQS